MKTIIHFIGFVVIFLMEASGYKILFMMTTAGPSHLNLVSAIANGLGDKNHSVTILSTSPRKSTHPNVEIHSTEAVGFSSQSVKQMMDTAADSSVVTAMMNVFGLAEHGCKILYEHPFTKKLMAHKRYQYDVVVLQLGLSECAMPFAAVLAPVLVYTASCPLLPWQLRRINSPPSYVPTFLLPYSDRMSFFERLNNAYIYAALGLYYEYIGLPHLQTIADKYFKNGLTVHEAEKKVHFVIVNQDPVLHSVRPTMPNVVNVGGYHCRPGLPLPKDLNDFVEGSGEHGFIMFGLGSNARSEFLGEETIQALVRTFARLKQRVIWKFEAQLENLPSNLKVVSWMPQQDLLAHPKIRLFITHGGLLSMQETMYHGVPVIGIPLFFDQFGNVGRMKHLGVGEHMDLRNITEELAYTLITNILNDKSYTENAKKYSSIFKDRPKTALESAVYWIEYAVRHQGADHLRSDAEDLNFFQYFLLDVAAVLVASSVAALLIFVKLVKLVLRVVTRCSKINADNEKKKRR